MKVHGREDIGYSGPTPISEVILAVKGERVYQDSRWNSETTTSLGEHSVNEFLLYIDDYVREAKQDASRNPDPLATRLVLDTLRKIAALSFAAMEQNGVVFREGYST